MKLIDEKGRLFGKVNVIDLLVLLLVIAVAVFVAVRAVGSGSGEEAPSSEGPADSALMTYQVRVTYVDPLAYETIMDFVDAASGKKDQLMSNNNMLEAYVVDCVATPHKNYVTTQDGQVMAVESEGDDERLDLVFTIEAEVTDTITNTVGSQQVRVGIAHIVKTLHFEFSGGVIIGADWDYREA